MALLAIRDITKVYPDGTEALRGVSFTIEKGEMVAIMGPSGSGKSTLLHILGFLDRHSGGTYHFQKKQFDDFAPEEIAQVRNQDMGFVFQMFNLLPHLTVLENVMLPLYYSNVPEKEWHTRATYALDVVGLSHRLSHTQSMLSGGERQRVAIARALIANPPVIFADEPTGNLDTASGEVVMRLLQQFHKEGKTILVITHEYDIARYCERLLYIKDGLLEKDEKIQDRIEV